MKALRVVAVMVGSLLAGALVFYLVYPQNLSHAQARLDTLRAELLKQTHVEAEFTTETTLFGEPSLEGHLTIVFPHVPPALDKKDLERVARAMIKEQLPRITDLDVRFGDNMRVTPLPSDKPEDPFDALKPAKKTGLSPR